MFSACVLTSGLQPFLQTTCDAATNQITALQGIVPNFTIVYSKVCVWGTCYARWQGCQQVFTWVQLGSRMSLLKWPMAVQSLLGYCLISTTHLHDGGSVWL
jgi:drug/metabolite transporter (DMT)-like permease